MEANSERSFMPARLKPRTDENIGVSASDFYPNDGQWLGVLSRTARKRQPVNSLIGVCWCTGSIRKATMSDTCVIAGCVYRVYHLPPKLPKGPRNVISSRGYGAATPHGAVAKSGNRQHFWRDN